MILIKDPFCSINEIWYSSRFFFNRSFFIMIGNKINIIPKCGSSSPEEKSINPPSSSISILFYHYKPKEYFNRQIIINFSFINYLFYIVSMKFIILFIYFVMIFFIMFLIMKNIFYLVHYDMHYLVLLELLISYES